MQFFRDRYRVPVRARRLPDTTRGDSLALGKLAHRWSARARDEFRETRQGCHEPAAAFPERTSDHEEELAHVFLVHLDAHARGIVDLFVWHEHHPSQHGHNEI